MKMIKLFAVMLSVLMILSACGGGAQTSTGGGAATAAGERTEPLVLRIGTVGSGREDDNLHLATEYLTAEIERRTDGMITFEYFPNSQLGAESSMFDQVLANSLDLTAVSGNTLSTVWPEFSYFSLPFAFPDVPTYWDFIVQDGIYERLFDVTWEGEKLVYLGAYTTSVRGCQNAKREIRSAGDMQGLKYRVNAGQLFTDIFTALGTSVANVNFSELYTAIQQGVVDGEDLSISYFYDNKFYEVEKYATELNAVLSNTHLIMAPETWQKLTADEQALFLEVMYGLQDVAVEFDKKTDEYYELVAQEGVSVVRYVDLTAEERQTFIDATADIWDDYEDFIGAEFFGYLNEMRANVVN